MDQIMNFETIKNAINAFIAEHAEEASALNDALASHPEAPGAERESVRLLRDFLEKYGFTIEQPFDSFDTAFRATAGSAAYPRRIAIVTDYDTASPDGHVTGNCAGAALAALAACAFAPQQETLQCGIDLIGAPASETGGTKVLMAYDQVFNGYDLAVQFKAYDRTLSSPRLLAFCNDFYAFSGTDEQAVKDAALLFLNAVDLYSRRCRDRASILSVIKADGCTAEIRVFTPDRASCRTAVKKIDFMAEGARLSTGTSWSKYKGLNPCDNLNANPVAEALLREVLTETGFLANASTDAAAAAPAPSGADALAPVFVGASDIGTVSQAVPTLLCYLDMTGSEAANRPAFRSPAFALAMQSEAAHAAIARGAGAMAQLIAKAADPEKCAAIRAAFQPPVPTDEHDMIPGAPVFRSRTMEVSEQ